MGRYRTAEDYYILGKERGLEWLGEEIFGFWEPGYSGKTLWHCVSCGYEWLDHYIGVEKIDGCPECVSKRYLPPQDYHNLAEKRGFEWVGGLEQDVPSNRTKTRWRCTLCGYVFLARYTDIEQGCVCFKCKRRPAQDYRTVGGNLIEWVGEEVPERTLDETEWRCKVCGYVWAAQYVNLQRGSGCPACNQSMSKGERSVWRALRRWGICHKSQVWFDDCRDQYPLRFDFGAFIPASKGSSYLLIEYDGVQHRESVEYFGGDEEFEKRQRRDAIKAKWAARRSIPLIRLTCRPRQVPRKLRQAIIDHTGIDPLALPRPKQVAYSGRRPAIQPEKYKQATLFT